jgi:hypothetical protein
VLRNPDKNNGETLRIMRKDDDGHLRQVKINYKDRRQGLILRNTSGKITDLWMTFPDHSMMKGTLDTDGRTIASGRYEDANGVLKAKFDANTIEGYQDDGKTLRFVQTKSANGWSYKFYKADGKTLTSEMEVTPLNIREWTKIYDDAGKLMYEEKHSTSSAPTGWGASQESYQGIAYNDQGKVTHKVIIEESYWDRGGGNVTSIDEIDADGVTVKNTIKVSPWYDPDHQIGRYASQKVLQQVRRGLGSQMTEAKSVKEDIQKQLTGLLVD